jgi:Common central domain of tyrosinase
LALGDGIRRNIAHVDPVERAMLKDAILEMHRRFYPGKREDTPPGGVSWWFKQDEIHAHTHVHGCPAFLPWHRELINRFEALLREINPALSLHYWDWTTDPGWMFTHDFMGNPHGDAGEPWRLLDTLSVFACLDSSFVSLEGL